MMRKIAYLTALLLLCLQAGAQNTAPLETALRAAIRDFDAQVGIAVCLDGKETLALQDQAPYPLMSVMKFHQAVAVLHTLESRQNALDSTLLIRRSDLRPDTWSPLRDRYGRKRLRLSIRELLEYTLLLSDNNACDLLFDRLLSPAATTAYLRECGIPDFNIQVNEAVMNARPERCRDNWSSPSSAVLLLEKILEGKLISPEHRTFLLETMLSCRTGEKRLPGFPHDATVRIGHKTGTGILNADGKIIGINDLGFILLPDGRRCTLAVFIKDSGESLEKSEALIGRLSGIVYEFMTGNL